MSHKHNYTNLMNQKPFVYETFTNSLGQKLDVIEHPTKGDSSYVIVVSHDLQLAEDSTFYETGDMTEDHKEYEPSFKDGDLQIGGFPAWD